MKKESPNPTLSLNKPDERGEKQVIVVTLRDGESIDRALRRFKQRCQRAGIYRDAKKASFYLKPSERKKIAKNLARKRHRRAAMLAKYN